MLGRVAYNFRLQVLCSWALINFFHDGGLSIYFFICTIISLSDLV